MGARALLSSRTRRARWVHQPGLSRHFCSECNRLRLTADGKLRPCLFSDDEYDVRTALRAGDDQAVRAVFAEALGAKPDEHHDKVGTERGMSQIGG